MLPAEGREEVERRQERAVSYMRQKQKESRWRAMTSHIIFDVELDFIKLLCAAICYCHLTPKFRNFKLRTLLRDSAQVSQIIIDCSAVFYSIGYPKNKKINNSD